MGSVNVAAIITAGGAGKRFGGKRKKQFMMLSGKPLLLHSMEAFEACDLIDEIVLVVPRDMLDYASREIVGKHDISKVSKVIAGGAERQHSVRNGFDAVSVSADIIVIHDGVRPFVATDMIESVVREAGTHGGAVFALQASDTVKMSDSSGFIENTVPRGSVWMAQTPQAFRYGVLKNAYAAASEGGLQATDESMLVERSGVKVKLLQGSPDNIKITTEEDFELAEFIYKNRTAQGGKTDRN